jgi:proliferating cell nuclear antigen
LTVGVFGLYNKGLPFMFEARLTNGTLLKKIIDSMSWISETNFDCNEAGVFTQAMDSNHVALASLELRKSGFQHFRCDRPLALGVHIPSMIKVMKCCGTDDILTLKADDDGKSMVMMFESSTGSN